MRTEIPNGPYTLCGWSIGGMVAISTAENLTKEEEERLEMLLIDDTNQKAYFAVQDIFERDEVKKWTYKAYTGC